MTDQASGSDLTHVVNDMQSAGDGKERVSVQALLEAAGQQSFGPLLLVPGLIVMSPIGGIPGVPTSAAIIVILVAGQLLLGFRSFWLPQFILKRSVSRARFDKAMAWLRPVARWIDKVISERLAFLTCGAFTYVIAASCVLIALIMPVLEVVPFANTATAAALCAFGLALVARDGLLAILAFLLTGLGIYIGVTAWPS